MSQQVKIVQTVNGMAHSGRIYQYENSRDAIYAADNFRQHFKHARVMDEVYVVVWND